MEPILGWLTLCTCALTVAAPPTSFVTTVTPTPNGNVCHTEPYVPHEGDFVLYNDHSENWRFLYRMVGSDMPDHAGLVVKLPDGRPAMLESGPDDGTTCGPYVYVLEALPRFCQFKGQFHGCIYIRRLKCPLTPEQSELLTEWALRQCGKHYPTCRLLLQGTPFQCRKGARADIFAKTYVDRKRWLCCEIGIAALCYVGVFDPHVLKGNRVYPRDVLYDDHYDLSATHLPAAEWTLEYPKDPLRPIQEEIPMDGQQPR